MCHLLALSVLIVQNRFLLEQFDVVKSLLEALPDLGKDGIVDCGDCNAFNLSLVNHIDEFCFEPLNNIRLSDFNNLRRLRNAFNVVINLVSLLPPLHP